MGAQAGAHLARGALEGSEVLAVGAEILAQGTELRAEDLADAGGEVRNGFGEEAESAVEHVGEDDEGAAISDGVRQPIRHV